jgi:putative peptide zinc metalloprotease protein
MADAKPRRGRANQASLERSALGPTTDDQTQNVTSVARGNDGKAPARAGADNEVQPEDVPDQPRLAPKVELSGAAQDGAFEEGQWLVQRDGRFIQVTELLYRVLEGIDGKRDLAGVAEAVSNATGRSVSPDNIRHLLASKLIPLGLVLQADGTVAASAAADRPRSALAVNMRMKMIGPRYIDPFTAVLQHLFAPPALIVVLLITLAAHGWLFLSHGIAGGFHDVLYSPGLLLAVLAIIVVSTAFHEFGHAAALRYGGGTVRGMGAGMYLVFPAFYTDVTDNYRLGRWARVRTDLGGFYFNLIFGTILIALYLVTGAEFLLLVVTFIVLEIVHQTLPFVRLDGYWALADLTGIPDFFSQIGPFLRTVLPLRFWKGRKLPTVKPWVKVVFGLYILITIPLLLVLLFSMIRGLPRVLATGWDSLNRQYDNFQTAQAAGDVLGIASAGAQTLLLLLPTIGMVYIIARLFKGLFTRIWNWSKPSAARRVGGTLATGGIVALLAMLWLPSIPFSGGQEGPLYARANFRPIERDERGTIRDAGINIPGVLVLTNRPDNNQVAPATGTATPNASPTMAGTQTVTATVTTTTTATTSPTPTVTTTTTATTTATATTTPTSPPTLTATPTPTATPAPPVPTSTSTVESTTGEPGLTPTTAAP